MGAHYLASDLITQIVKALSGNISITLLSCICPIVVGILLTLLCRTHRVVGMIVGWLSVPIECLCPIVLLYVIYFFAGSLLPISPFILCVLTFSIAFIGYMPARYVREYSLLKNVLYNALGVIRTTFMWSFCVSVVGQSDLLGFSRQLFGRTYDSLYFIIPLIVSFLCLLCIEVMRVAIKQFLK